MTRNKREERFLLEGQYDKLIKSFGVNVEEVLRKAGIPEDIFSHRSPSITQEQYFALMTVIENSMSDPALTVKIASSDKVEYFSPPIFAAYCSKDAHTCIERLAKYKSLIGPLRFITERSNGVFLIEIRAGGDVVLPSLRVEMEIVFLLHIIRNATRTHVTPIRLIMRRLITERTFVDFVGITPEMGEKNLLILSEHDITLPFITRNDMMWSYFEPELRRRLYDLKIGDNITTRLRAALIELLPGGSCEIDDAAQKLGLSRRTLQRRLKEEGTTFQQELDSVRESLAEHYLEDANLTMDSIAYLLGYQELNSFRRAFTSWTGFKLGEYRRTKTRYEHTIN